MVKRSLEMVLYSSEGDLAAYLQTAGDLPSFDTSVLRGKLKEAADMVKPDDPESSNSHGLVYLAAVRAGDQELAQTQWNALLSDLKKGNRDQKQFAKLLAGTKPLTDRAAQRAPIDPSSKRVLLTVLAQRFPDHAKELLPLAKRLNFQRDAISLCLNKFGRVSVRFVGPDSV